MLPHLTLKLFCKVHIIICFLQRRKLGQREIKHHTKCPTADTYIQDLNSFKVSGCKGCAYSTVRILLI